MKKTILGLGIAVITFIALIGIIIYGYLNSGSINAGRTAVVSVYVFILATMIVSCIKQVVLEIKNNK